MSLTVLSHVEPGEVWGSWLGEPLALLGLVAATWCYARGTRAIWGQVGRGRVVRRSHGWAWALATATLAVALLSPLEAVAGSLFSAHMLQHVLLTVVAAPLLVLSRPVVPLLRGLPHPLRRRAARWRQQAQPAVRLTFTGGWPLAVAGLYAAVTLVWHLPGPYQAAVGSDAVHAIEHASFLGAAALLWWAIRETGQRSHLGHGMGILVVFVVAVVHTAIGAVLTFAPNLLYPHYAVAAEAWEMGPLRDQHLAGLAMWAPSKLVHGAVVVMLAVAWLRTTEARAAARPA